MWPILADNFESELNEVRGNLDRAHPLFYESISGLFIPELSEEPASVEARLTILGNRESRYWPKSIYNRHPRTCWK